MRKFLFTIILFGLMINANCQTNISGGNVCGIWTFVGSPYLVQGSIVIPNDSTLIIEPGVIVNFQGHYKFLIQGSLIAIGTINDSILFTTSNTTIGWYGIRFDNTPTSNDSSKIKYCSIQWGIANGIANDEYGGALNFNNFSKAIVDHCVLKNNSAVTGGGGIYCNNSNPIISNNIISNNTASYEWYYYGGGGIECNNNSNPKIANNFISNNSSYGYGGGIHCSYSNPSILNNMITNNSANKIGGGIYCNGSNPTVSNNIISYNNANQGYFGWGGGGGIQCEYSNPIINNNIISNNSTNFYGGGICIDRSDPIVYNNIISNNFALNGGGMAFGDCSSTITNNTICNNSASNGGGIFCINTSNLTFHNCILYNNKATNGDEIFLFDEQSDPNFNYCDVQNGVAGFEINGNFYTGTYQNNIDKYPYFILPSTGIGTSFNGVTANWSLQSLSPCINSGDPNDTYPATDIAGNPRISSCNIDIGAYEYQILTPLSATIFSQTNVTCFGGNNGIADVTASGGSASYSYLWSNSEQTFQVTSLSAGTYSVTITDAHLCSITASVTITQPAQAIINNQLITLCAGEGVTIGIHTYNMTGIYTDILTAVNGCDSTITTNLNVKHIISVNQTLIICEGESITIGTNIYNLAGIYTDVLTTSNGCDSTVTTNLIINQPTHSSQTFIECDGFSVTIGSNTYNITGVYTDILTSIYGCDSTVITNLIIKQPTITPIITKNGNVLLSDAPSGNQWYELLSGLIPSATFSYFIPSISGDYFVIVAIDDCQSDSSNIIHLINTENEELATNSKPKIYSNLANENIIIEGLQINKIEIINSIGQVIKSINVSDTKTNIDISKLAGGIYMIRIQKDNYFFVNKLIKQ